MKLALVALGWAGVAAVVAGARVLAERLDAGPAEGEAASVPDHLASQRCETATLALELVSDPLELRGQLHATVVGDAPYRQLHVVAAADVELVSCDVDGVAAEESTPWLASLIATPRAERRLVLARRTRSPTAEVTLRFRRAVGGPGRDALPLICDPVAFAELAPDADLSQFVVVVPEGLAMVTAGPTPDTFFERGPGRHALGPWARGHAPLLIGRLQRRTSEPLGALSMVGAPADLPSRALEERARELLVNVASRVASPPRTVLFRNRPDAAEPHAADAPDVIVELGGGWFAAAPPRTADELACIVLATALAATTPDRSDPLVAALPAALVLQALEAADEPGALALPGYARAPAVARGVKAWRTLEAVFGERARAAARQLLESRVGRTDGTASPPPTLLAEAAPRAIVAWALAGVEVRLEGWRASLLHGRTVASGEIVVDPPPPLHAPLAIALWVVGKERMRQERILVSSARTRFDGLELSEPPIEVVLDPEGRLPHVGDATPVVSLDVAPSAFAVAPDASALAVALVRGGAEPLCGVSILRADAEGELSFTRWQQTQRPARALEWGVPGRFLAIDDANGRSDVLDVVDGSLLPFDGVLQIAPRRGWLIESSERAPGCFSHTLHDLSGALSWPLPVPRRGPVQWVAGGDDLVTAGTEGRATIVDRRGRTRLELPLLLRGIRVLRREPFGFVAAVDTADGGRVTLFDTQGEELRSLAVVGRVRSISDAADTGALLIGAEIGPHEHVVTRVGLDGGSGTLLYRGPDRPLAGAPSRRGLLLVDARSDEAPPDEPRRLEFVSFEALARGGVADGGDALAGGEVGRRLVSEEAFLDPPPVVASAGRYLYYLRARGGPRGLRGDLRPRALHRYDFLTGREEPLEIAGR